MYRAGMVPTDKDVIEVHECTHCCPEAIDHPIWTDTPFFGICPITRFIRNTQACYIMGKLAILTHAVGNAFFLSNT